jgi:hypothetical protein
MWKENFLPLKVQSKFMQAHCHHKKKRSQDRGTHHKNYLVQEEKEIQEVLKELP